MWAHLTLIQSWIAAGMSMGKKRLGMFEHWASVIGGILEHAGIPGFLDSGADLYEESDDESTTMQAFLAQWSQEIFGDPVSTAELLDTAKDHFDLGLPPWQSQKIRLGKILTRNRDRQFGNFRLEKAGMYQGSALWRLVKNAANAKAEKKPVQDMTKAEQQVV